MNILFTTNIPSPYVVDYLNELSRYADVTVLFECMSARDRDASWYKNQEIRFQYADLKAVRTGADSGLSFRILPYLRRKTYDVRIIANPTTPTGIIALLFCRVCRIPFVLQSEGGFQGSGRGLKEHFKKFLMEKAAFFLTGMGGENDYFLRYGAAPEKLKPYPFTSLSRDRIDTELLTSGQKREVRDRLGMNEEKIILTVGSFIHRKGFDVLLESIAGSGMPDRAGYYFVGGEPTEEYRELIGKLQIGQQVHFIGFCTPEKVREYYHAADIFVLPTREDTWGLVINEAMAGGLPVITTDRCVAGMELIEEGVNGYIVPVEDADTLGDRIRILCSDDALCRQMGENNLRKIRDYSIENMAKTIYGHLSENTAK